MKAGNAWREEELDPKGAEHILNKWLAEKLEQEGIFPNSFGWQDFVFTKEQSEVVAEGACQDWVAVAPTRPREHAAVFVLRPQRG